MTNSTNATSVSLRLFRSTRFWLAATAIFILAMAVVLLLMGREPICKCGYVKLWEGVVNSAGNSQHISDWYTPSHIIHGFLFYGALLVSIPQDLPGTPPVSRRPR